VDSQPLGTLCTPSQCLNGPVQRSPLTPYKFTVLGAFSFFYLLSMLLGGTQLCRGMGFLSSESLEEEEAGPNKGREVRI
jgi:hypothetical protein